MLNKADKQEETKDRTNLAKLSRRLDNSTLVSNMSKSRDLPN